MSIQMAKSQNLTNAVSHDPPIIIDGNLNTVPSE